MPRTFKATIALIVTLIALAILTIINVAQTNSAEGDILELRQKVDALTEMNAKILDQLEQGVAVSGTTGQRGATGGDRYAAALNDPDNILQRPQDQLIFPDAKQGGTLRRSLGDTPKGFNWVTENSADVSELQTYAHNTFARQDLVNPDNYVPDLAYKVTVNDDWTEYTIHLREGVYWHVPNIEAGNDKLEWAREPREVTAEDAVFTFNLIKDPQVQAGFLKAYFQDMEKAEVVDRYTFKVHWKKKTYQSKSATMTMYPMPKWLYTKDESGEDLPAETLGLKFNSHWASKYPIGTGPYKITDIEKGKRIVLERNENYWDEKPPIEKIEYRIIKDPETAFIRLKANEVDITTLTPPRYKELILEAGPQSPFEQGELEYRKVDRFAYYYVGWNADKPMFADKRVRTAMTHAFNRQGIIDNVLHGLGVIQKGPFYYEHPANNPNIKPLAFDLDKAKKLLDEAGWTDSDGDGIRDKMVDGTKTDFKFSLLAYNKPTTRSMLNVYKEDLRKIGIVMTPMNVDWATMQKKMDEKKFDAFTGGWALGWEIDPYQIWHSSQADIPKGSNRVGFRNERADQIIEELRSTFDRDKRIELLREFHSIVHEEQPYTFLYAPKSVFAWQPKLENVVFQKIRPQDLSLPWYIDPSEKTAKQVE